MQSQDMHKRVKLAQFPTGSILKFGIMANLGIWIPIGLVISVLDMMGYDTIGWYEPPDYCLSGVILGPLVAGILALLSALLFMIGALMLRAIPFLANKIEFDVKMGTTAPTTDQEPAAPEQSCQNNHE